MDRLWLLIDADDTLWENNVYFEEAFEEFVELLAHSRLTPAEVRAVLDEIELASIETHGYGSKCFGRNLESCFVQLAERHYGDADLARVTALAERILERPVELLEGVVDTLAYLAGRHHLTLFTKGDPGEQRRKLERSRLELYFHDCCILREKDVEAYRSHVEQAGKSVQLTWMIGNSPKSDVHPALEAGLGSVLVPHARTWSLEVRDLPPRSERFEIVERFGELRRLF